MRHENLNVNKLRVSKLYDGNNNEITGNVSPTGGIVIFDDFLGASGGDASVNRFDTVEDGGTSVLSAFNQNGDMILTTSTTDNHGNQVFGVHPGKANYGGLFMEARVKNVTDITNIALFVGFHDTVTIEEPLAYSGTTLTAQSGADTAGFLYDVDGTTDQYIAATVDSGTADSSGLLGTGAVPVADAYQTFRVEISKDGLTCKFFIDGNLAATQNTAGVTETVALYPMVSIHNRSAASNVVHVDYMMYGWNRV